MLRFDNKVAIVTGAGGGLGRAYALLLASRGAKVVVNDLGGDTKGDSGGSSRAADRVVKEIKDAGGDAVANYDSVVNGDRIVKTAIDTYGAIHIVINNAGILRDVAFHNMTDKDWDLIYEVHVKGSVAVARAAWPYMREQRYGRVVNTSSAAGLYGNFGQANYSTAKLALLGLSQTLAKEGAKRNILVNAIAPIAGSRMTATVMPPDMVEALKPDYVAPLVAFLCHEECSINGECFEVGAGWAAKVRFQRSSGAHLALKQLSPESIRDSMDRIRNFDRDVEYPTSPGDATGKVLAFLESADAGSDAAADASTSAAASGVSLPNFKCSVVFEQMKATIESDPSLVKKVNGVIQYNVTGANNEVAHWTVDLKSGRGSVTASKASGKADLTLVTSDAVLVEIASGKSNPQKAFMSGKLKLKGNVALAMKLGKIIQSTSKL